MILDTKDLGYASRQNIETMQHMYGVLLESCGWKIRYTENPNMTTDLFRAERGGMIIYCGPFNSTVACPVENLLLYITYSRIYRQMNYDLNTINDFIDIMKDTDNIFNLCARL